jgi:hypothetical protein
VLNRILRDKIGASLALFDDHTLLPKSFARTVAQAGRSCPVTVHGAVPLGQEVTAHILTGNLDPFENYESLVRAFTGPGGAAAPEAVRVLSSDAWYLPDREPMGRIQELVVGEGDLGFPILRLSD